MGYICDRCKEPAIGYYSDGSGFLRYYCQEHAPAVLQNMKPGELKTGINTAFQRFPLEETEPLEIVERSCPHCGDMIDELVCYEGQILERRMNASVYQPKGGKKHLEITWEWKESHYDGGDTDFQCPSCDRVLFNDEENAIAWLKYPEGDIQPVKYPDTYFNVLRIAYADIEKAIADDHYTEDAVKPVLIAAVPKLGHYDMQRIAEKVGNSCIEGGDFWIAVAEAARPILQDKAEENCS